MTQERLYTGTTDNIGALIEQCDFPKEAFLLLEQVPRQVVNDNEREPLLRFARLGDKIDLAPYTGGRIFTRAFELRWEQEGTAARVVYLGKPRPLPGLQDQEIAFDSTGDENPYYLFGTLLAKEDLQAMDIQPEWPGQTCYAEVRIPRVLRYPIAATARVQVVVGEYYHAQWGRLVRFLDAQPAQEDGE